MSDLVIAAGGVCVVAGVALFDLRAALIVAGVALIRLGFVLEPKGKKV